MEGITEFFIKGMVCDRCKTIIYNELSTSGFDVTQVSLGKISFSNPIPAQEFEKMDSILTKLGFEIFVYRYSRVTKEVKAIINNILESGDIQKHHRKISDIIAEKTNQNYNSISEIFRNIEGITIERYLINKRIEKVKERITYTDLSLTEIAYISGFNSVNHLSSQFKDLTGLNPTYYRKSTYPINHK
jgi:AraC family transcriptional regulator